MQEEFSHLPVMAREVVDLLLAVPRGLIVDCTVGGGGHSAVLLDARPDVHVLGLDREVMVAGGFDHIEIWDAQMFGERDAAGIASIEEGEGINDFL